MKPQHVIAGIGCRQACAADDLLALLRQAEMLDRSRITAIACPDFKAAHGAVQGAAALLQIPLIPIRRADLESAQPRCPSFSVTAQAVLGIGSVAEACALLAAGANSRLRLPRITNAMASCALAEATG